MGNKIDKSIVAQGGSTISNSTNSTNQVNVKKIRAESAIVGFIVGIITSIISSYIYDMLKQSFNNS